MDYMDTEEVMVTNTGRLTSEARREAHKIVRNLQSRIVKAVDQGDGRRAKQLRRLLKRSFSLKLLAANRVRCNEGGKTPGVDGFIIKDRETFVQALGRDYWKSEPSPVRREWIPKKPWDKINKRPLGIPTTFDRIGQTMMAMIIEPEAELKFHDESYGFRPERSTWDAIESIWSALNSHSTSSEILDADIEKCYDRIDHEALLTKLEDYVHDRQIKGLIRKHLKAGLIEMKTWKYEEVTVGTPQGGPLSPLLANIALDGIESCSPGIKIVRYADDLVTIGRTKGSIEKAKEDLQRFLQPMGLNLAEKKTRIVSRLEGFDFLGFNVRMRTNKLITQPAKDNIKRHKTSIARIIKTGKTQAEIIEDLNPVLTGWANYYSSVCSKRTYSNNDNYIFGKLLKWAIKKHSNIRSKKKVIEKYSHREDTRNWVFSCIEKGKKSRAKKLTLAKEEDTKIQRHVKIRKGVNPYRPEDRPYFEEKRKRQLFRTEVGRIARAYGCSCYFCGLPIETNGYSHDAVVHHVVPLSMGGKNQLWNLRLAHRHCHIVNPHGSHLNRPKDECGARRNGKGINPAVLMESRMRGNSHVRFGVGENP